MKTCTKCLLSKDLSKFHKQKDGYLSHCKACRNIAAKDYRGLNKDRILSYQEKIRSQRRSFVNSLKNKPCTDCKNSYPYYVMDFDHLKDKEDSIGHLLYIGASKETLLAEIAKCELVCSNCHRERTQKRLIDAS